MTALETRTAWLYGPVTDLLLGCGGASILLTFAIASFGSGSLKSLLPFGVIIGLFSLPHYGATLVRVFDESEETRRNAWVIWGGSTALAALFILALHAPPVVGSLLLTIYLTWSPWHYSGQNYGITSMLLGRRGVRLSGTGARALRYSFWLSFVLTFFAMHGSERAANYTPVPYGGSIYSLMPLGIPVSISQFVITAAAIGYVVCIGLAIRAMLRSTDEGLKAIYPALLLMATQAMWFVVPALVRMAGLAFSIPAFAQVYSRYGFLWFAAAHAIQYLWITSYFHCLSRAGDKPPVARDRFVFFAKAATAGFAVWVLPVVFFAPGYLGSLPGESGLALLVAAIVNLHHFILDGTIWKLRSKSIANELFSDITTLGRKIGGLPWLAPALYAAGTAALLIHGVSWYEGKYGFEKALDEGRLDRAHIALERLAKLGGDGPSKHARLGAYYSGHNQVEPALREFRRSNALHPNADAWFGLGGIHEQVGNWKHAVTAFQNAERLDREDGEAAYHLGLAWLQLGNGRNAEAALLRALAVSKDQTIIRGALGRARTLKAKGGSESAEPIVGENTKPIVAKGTNGA